MKEIAQETGLKVQVAGMKGWRESPGGREVEQAGGPAKGPAKGQAQGRANGEGEGRAEGQAKGRAKGDEGPANGPGQGRAQKAGPNGPAPGFGTPPSSTSDAARSQQGPGQRGLAAETLVVLEKEMLLAGLPILRKDWPRAFLSGQLHDLLDRASTQFSPILARQRARQKLAKTLG